MDICCPNCKSGCVKRNGFTDGEKQNHRCLACGRQFVDSPSSRVIDGRTKHQVQQALLERVSLQGITRIFGVSMPWLLNFLNEIINKLPDDLNATVRVESDELDVAVLELDEQWSYVGSKKNPQWLWLAFHSATRQVLAMHVGKRTRKSAEILLKKLPDDLKKKPSFTQIVSRCTTTFFPGRSIIPLARSQGKPVTLSDLTVPSGRESLA